MAKFSERPKPIWNPQTKRLSARVTNVLDHSINEARISLVSGKITVQGTESVSSTLDVDIQVAAKSEKKAKKALKKTQKNLTVAATPESVNIKDNSGRALFPLRGLLADIKTSRKVATGKEADLAGQMNPRVDVSLTVPTQQPMNLDVGTGMGNIKIKNIRGSGKNVITTGIGEITIHSSQGDFHIKTTIGSIDIMDHRGNVTTQIDMGKLQITSIQGNLNASTKSGTIEVSGLTGKAEIKTDEGDIQVGNTLGAVDVTSANGAIDIYNLEGSVTAQTDFGDVSLDDAELHGSNSLETKGGSAYLGTTNKQLKIIAEASDGRITTMKNTTILDTKGIGTRGTKKEMLIGEQDTRNEITISNGIGSIKIEKKKLI